MTDSRLEPFLLLARSAKGAAAAKVVENATAAVGLLMSPGPASADFQNGVYTFGALMDVPNIKEVRKVLLRILTSQLSQSPESQKHWNLLQLFAYGTLKDYASCTQPPLARNSLTMQRPIPTLLCCLSRSPS